MAPKGGRGGGSRGGGGSISSCPGAFSTTQSQVYFACDVIFLVVFLGISFTFCSFRKKSGPGKKLIGPPFIFALFFYIISLACSVLATVLQECGTTDIWSYYDWQIAITVLSFIGNWLILFILVWTLNTMLQTQVGLVKAIFKVVLLASLGVMGALTVAYMGLSSYNLWTQTRAGQEQDADVIVKPQIDLSLAYWVLYLITVVAAGALAFLSLRKLRSNRHPAGNLIGWVIALFFFTIFWILLLLVFAGARVDGTALTFETAAALSYLINIFQALTFIAILCIAKHAAWAQAHAVSDPAAMQNGTYPNKEQFAYIAPAAANAPAYTATPAPAPVNTPPPAQGATAVPQQQSHASGHFYNVLQPGQQPPPGTMLYYYQQTPNGPIAVPVQQAQGHVQQPVQQHQQQPPPHFS